MIYSPIIDVDEVAIYRLNGTHMLEMLRGKRLVFVGDSLNRNMWQSLVCILRNSVKDQRNVYEAFGRHHFRTEASHYFVFKVSCFSNSLRFACFSIIHFGLSLI